MGRLTWIIYLGSLLSLKVEGTEKTKARTTLHVLYQTFKEECVPIFLKLFQNDEEKETLPN